MEYMSAEEEFEEFVATAFKEPLPPSQKDAVKKVFIAGAFTVFASLIRHTTTIDDLTDFMTLLIADFAALKKKAESEIAESQRGIEP